MENVGFNLRKRYILALSIIAALVIGSQFIIQYTIRQNQGDSRVINIAGRQRMLSQRINKCVFGAMNASSQNEKTRYLSELETSIQLWERSHRGLQYGDSELGLPGRNSDQVKSLFVKADPYFNNILNASKAFVSDNDKSIDSKMKLLQIVKDNERDFLKFMDMIVFQYDAEANSKIQIIRTVEIVLLLFTFLVLALEARYIFYPAEKSIQKAFSDINESNENILNLFEIAPAALMLLSYPDLAVIQMNSFAENYLDDYVRNKGKVSFPVYFQENLENDRNLFHRMMAGESFSNEEAVLKSPDNIRAVLVSCRPMQYNNITCFIISMMDISRQKHAEAILKKYATTDCLTGLLNRRSGRNILDNTVERSIRDKQELAVCFCDIDGLKPVNDSYGHEEGDWYIIAVSDSITSNLREDDFAFRYGGDEIIVVLNNCNLQVAESIVKRINTSLANKRRQLGKPYDMSVSIGIASLQHNDVSSVEDLISTADHLMYEEKKRKRSQRTE